MKFLFSLTTWKESEFACVFYSFSQSKRNRQMTSSKKNHSHFLKLSKVWDNSVNFGVTKQRKLKFEGEFESRFHC
jgi:hypothetical protein